MFRFIALKLFGCWQRFASWFEPRRELADLEESARGREKAAAVLFELFWLYLRLDSYVNAERCMRRYVELYPMCAPAHAEIAKACMLQGRHKQALKDAARSLRYDGNCWLAHVITGDTHLRLGNWAKAAAALRQALWLSDVDAEDGQVHALIAKAYAGLGDGNRAQAHQERADQLRPKTRPEDG